jgi:hypothetical protein
LLEGSFVTVAEDRAADRVAFALELVPALEPVPALGMATEVPLAGVVLVAGVELPVSDGDGDVDGEGDVLVPVGVGVGGLDRIGVAVDGCPELYGVALGLQVFEVPGELGTEE